METYASVGHNQVSVWDTMARAVGRNRRGAWDATGGARGTRGTRRVAASQTATKRPVATNHPMALSPIQMALLVLCIAPAILIERARGGMGGNLYEACACPSDVGVDHVPKRRRKQMVRARTMHGPWKV